MESIINIPQEDVETCLRVLQTVSEDPSLIDGDERIKALIAKIHREGKRGVRRAEAQRRQAEDRQAKAGTGIVRRTGQEQEPGEGVWGTLNAPATCYVCKAAYTRVHPWYHQLCPDCAAISADKRRQRADLAGRTALITGGRVKIGFALALRMLRDGARVIVTTRFPADAARRFAGQPDQAEWAGRLRIEGLDLRHVPQVERFAQSLLDGEPALDVLVNNAAQTVKRPLAFYQHLLDGEPDALTLPDARPWLLEAWPDYPDTLADNATHFPPGTLDLDGQQLDTRPTHSWRLRLDEVGALELLEVYLVNAAGPFLLSGRLKPLLLRSPFPRRFIVNVSAMEGQFGRESKTIFHPHTNMAKAALNMMTRTSAADYVRDGIYVNSVDTGWVTDENPHPQRVKAQQERGFHTPLDVWDAVARLYDPIVQGLTCAAEPPFGHFLKDFKPYAW